MKMFKLAQAIPSTMKARKILLAASLMLPLCSCVNGMRVEIAGDLNNPVFSLSKASAFGADPCLTYISIWAVPEGGSPLLMWRAQAQSGCVSPKSISYLGPNMGLRTTSPPMPLAERARYNVVVEGWGRLGSCVFYYEDHRFQTDRSRCP